jgi:hypothetical protein
MPLPGIYAIAAHIKHAHSRGVIKKFGEIQGRSRKTDGPTGEFQRPIKHSKWHWGE